MRVGVECYLEPLAQIMSVGKGEGVDQASGPLNIRDENTEGRGSWGLRRKAVQEGVPGRVLLGKHRGRVHERVGGGVAVVSEASGLPSKVKPRQGVTVSLTRTASFEERGQHPVGAWGWEAMSVCLPFRNRPVLSCVSALL